VELYCNGRLQCFFFELKVMELSVIYARGEGGKISHVTSGTFPLFDSTGSTPYADRRWI